MVKLNITHIVFALIILLYSAIELVFISTEDLTSDETAHVSYGIKILNGNPYKRSCTLDDSKMPVSALNGIPRAIEQLFHPGLTKSDTGVSDAHSGRYITFLFSLISLFIVFKWSSEWYGKNAGLFSMALTAFCPTFLAHSGLVTTEAYSVLIILLVLYTLWKYLNTRSRKYFILFCVCTGVAQISKQTFFHLYILLPLFFLIYNVLTKASFSMKAALLHFLIFAAINLFIINAGYLFYESGKPLAEYVFVSKLFNNVQQSLHFIGNVPLPFPSPFLIGMDSIKYVDEIGGGYPEDSFPMVSISGLHEPGKSYWFYYLVTMFFKVPIPTLIFFVIAFLYLFRKSNRAFFISNEMILAVPVLFFLFIMSFFNNIQSGVRHILFLFPLLYILCGKIILNVSFRSSKILIAGCCVWLMVSVFRYTNDYIPYTNEFIFDKKLAFQKAGASNIDYGQGYTAANEYIKKHPDVHYAGTEPGKGKFIIKLGNYEDIFSEHNYTWIQHYLPYSHIKYTYLLIEVK